MCQRLQTVLTTQGVLPKFFWPTSVFKKKKILEVFNWRKITSKIIQIRKKKDTLAAGSDQVMGMHEITKRKQFERHEKQQSNFRRLIKIQSSWKGHGISLTFVLSLVLICQFFRSSHSLEHSSSLSSCNTPWPAESSSYHYLISSIENNAEALPRSTI